MAMVFFNQEKHIESDKEDEESHCSSKEYSQMMQHLKLFVGFFIWEQFEIEAK